MRLLIAEDEALLREGLARLLRDEGYEVVDTAADASALLDRARELRPDLVITDIRMPPGNARDGVQAALALRRELPGLAVIVLSQHVDSAGTTELLADGAGRIGYLLKQRLVEVQPFLDAVADVLAGGTVVDPTVVEAMMLRSREANAIDDLSPRRRETLALMAEGMSNARIAERMVVTEHAVARNISAIFDSLGLPPSPDDHRRVLAVLRYLGREVR